MTENVTVPMLYMSLRVNIMATLVAISLSETMRIHGQCFLDNGDGTQ